jgi:hypothetical protein
LQGATLACLQICTLSGQRADFGPDSGPRAEYSIGILRKGLGFASWAAMI